MSSEDLPTTDSPIAPPTSQVETPVEASQLVNAPRAKLAGTLYGLGRRITSRTTDLLAIAIVLIASLTIGRQLLSWWHDEPPAVVDIGPLEGLEAEWGANFRPVSLEFGNGALKVTRQSLPSSDPQSALDVVLGSCQAILVTSEPPASPPDHAELDQLKALSKLTADVEQPGSWQLFIITGGLPMVVGVKTFSADTEKLAGSNPSDGRRVVCWGLVFPGLSPGSWTAYTFVRRPVHSTDLTDVQSLDIDLSRVDLPAGSQRTVLMQEAGQSGLLGFQGAGSADAWRQHFSTWFQAQGWTQPDSWQPLQGGWSGQFVRQESGRRDESTIHVQCYQQQSGQGVGLIQWFPGRKPVPESPPASSRGTP